MATSTRRLARVALGSLLALGLAAAPAQALTTYASNVGPIYSGGDFANLTNYNGNVQYIDGKSDGTAYSGVWIVNSSLGRVSQDFYCNSPGCLALGSWSGSKPAGFPNVHNHGNASPSWFSGTWQGL